MTAIETAAIGLFSHVLSLPDWRTNLDGIFEWLHEALRGAPAIARAESLARDRLADEATR